MKSIFVSTLALVSCLAVVQGYDFSDPDFNALLAADYAEFMSDSNPEDLLTNYRTKRDAPCHGPGGHKKEFPSQRCCNEAIENPSSMEKIKDLKKECFGKIKENRTESESELDAFSCERLQKKKTEIRCAYECILKKQLMFKEDDQVDEKTALEYFRKELVDTPWVKDNLEKIITDCAAEGATPTAVLFADTVTTAAVDKKVVPVAREIVEEEKDKCSPKPMKFLFCMWREYTKKCPTEQQKDTKTCNLIREGKLEFEHHGHHHGHHHHHHHD